MRETGCSERSEAVLSGSRRLRWIALAAVAVPILVVTLVPGSGASAEPISVWCVICGWRGLSDAILNVALFVPLGFALGALGRGIGQALGVGLVVSIAIEAAQTVIPFRYPGLGDVLYNALGCATGTILFGARHRLFFPRPSSAARNTAAWGVVGLVLLSLQGWLLAPDIPAHPHWVQWTPESPDSPAYPGRLLRVDVDGRRITRPPWTGSELLAADDPILRGLEEGTEIELSVAADTQPRATTPLWVLKGREGGESLFIGVDHRDLIVRYRTHGMALHLDRPYPRWRGAAAWSPGDTAIVRIRGIGRRLTASVEVGRPPAGVGPEALTVSAARGWGFLMFPTSFARLPGGGQDLLWMLVLALPLGYWGPVRRAAAFGAIWAAALLLAPFAFPLLAASLHGVAGVALGIVFGRLARFIRDDPEPFMFWRPLDTSIDDFARSLGATRRRGGRAP